FAQNVTPSFRKHLGLLEKKKDYKLRADDYRKKQKYLRALRKKALEKNPDEFYYKMTRVKLQDGVHVIKETKEEVTPEQLKLMRTQDVKYIEMKRVAEAKVTTKTLYSDMFLLVKKRNRNPLISSSKERQKQYNCLTQRIEREKKLFVIAQKIQTRRDLLDKTQKVKKIERLKSELHLLDFQGKQQKKHVFFFDTKKEVEQFDIATHLRTAPELVDRVFNRPTIETLQKEKVKGVNNQTRLKV
ncbi:hypothetical protein E2I00_012389, partial [Balaenoptera physalus]